MFKKIGNLTYNELVKQFKKTSIKIIIALMLIMAILLPIGLNLFNINNNISNGNALILQQKDEQLQDLKNDKTEGGRINTGILQLEKDIFKLKVDNEFEFNDWREREIEEYSNNAMEIFALKEIINGVDYKVLRENIYNINTDALETYFELSKEELNKKLNEFNNANEEIKNIIINKDYLKYLSKNIKRQEQFIENDKKTIEELEKNLKKDPNSIEIKNQVEDLKKSVFFTEKLLEIDKYRYENKIDFSDNNWRNKTLKDIVLLQEELNMTMLTESQFQRDLSINSSKVSYDKYKEIFKENQKDMKEKIDRNWYSLKNDLPQLEFVKDARSIVDGVYEIFIIITVLIMIIIGGGIVSSEFSKGTIRLLMIRPVSRGKILLSKLLALIIIAFGMILSSVFLLTITSGIVYGFDTLQTAVIQTIGGQVIAVPYLKYILSKVLMSSAGVVFIISLVFMISTLIKNTAIAVSVSTIIYLGAMPLTILLGISNISWIANTIIPYINQSMFNLAPFFIESLKMRNGITLNFNFGAIQILIIALVMIITTFIIFIKKDIKN